MINKLEICFNSIPWSYKMATWAQQIKYILLASREIQKDHGHVARIYLLKPITFIKYC